MKLRAGIDVGSTTVKLVILDENNQTIFAKYERHFSDVKTATKKVFKEAQAVVGDQKLALTITGSGGMGLAEVLDVPLCKKSSPVPAQ